MRKTQRNILRFSVSTPKTLHASTGLRAFYAWKTQRFEIWGKSICYNTHVDKGLALDKEIEMEVGTVYWNWNRTFIVGKVGTKWITGLVIEADGLRTEKARPDDLTQAMYKGKPYPPRKARGYIRKMAATTKGAAKLKKEILA